MTCRGRECQAGVAATVKGAGHFGGQTHFFGGHDGNGIFLRDIKSFAAANRVGLVTALCRASKLQARRVSVLRVQVATRALLRAV